MSSKKNKTPKSSQTVVDTVMTEEVSSSQASVTKDEKINSEKISNEKTTDMAQEDEIEPVIKPSIKSNKHTKKNYNSYESYIYKVLKQVHPDVSITQQSMGVFSSLVEDIRERVTTEAGKLAKSNKRQTISAREIQTAVKLIFSGDLGIHAVSEGTKAVTKYVASANNDKTGIKIKKDQKKNLLEKKRMKSSMAGLQFPVARVFKSIKDGNYAKRVGIGAGVFLAAILEYISAEVLELAGNNCKDAKPARARILPNDINMALKNDVELNILFDNVYIPSGGVVPSINIALLKKKPEPEPSQVV